MEAAGAPKLTVFLKKFSVPARNTISALMFTTFRQVKIQLIFLPEAETGSNSAWEQVEYLFGLHTFDLMSLDR